MSDSSAIPRIGIVGCGRMGRVHAGRIRQDGRARVAGFVETAEQRPAAAALRDQIATDALVFDDLDALLEQARLDAAVICTPTTCHFSQVMRCRESRLPVLCEKPLAATREEIVRLIEASQTGPLLAVAYQRRCWSVYRTMRREVLSGRWGNVRAVTSVNSERWQQTIPGTWRDDPQINPGGFVGDAGSHKIDVVFFVTGRTFEQATAQSDCCGSRVPIVTMLHGRLTDGVPLAMSFVGHSQTFVEDLFVHCTDADLILRNGKLRVLPHSVPLPDISPEPDSNPTVAFLDMLTGGAPNFAPAECALPVFDLTQTVLFGGIES